MSLEHVHGLLLNHKQLPISELEKSFFSDIELALELFKNNDGIEGVAILQTCNRVEVYLEAVDERAVRRVLDLWKDLTNDASIGANITWIRSSQVVRHLFRLASGLESMVVGEQEILRQVKETYYKALSLNTLSQLLKLIFEEAIRIGKRVRSETEISSKKVSLAHVAVEAVEKILKNLNDKVILIIGAGETGELVNSALSEKDYRKLTLLFANRTYERAIQLANISRGIALRLEQVENYLHVADIVFVTTSAPHYIITKEKVEEAIKKRNKSLLIVDLSVPRNADPGISNLPNVKLVTLDNLREYIDTAGSDRIKEVEKVEALVEDYVWRFLDRLETLWIEKLISKIYCYAEKVRAEEVSEALTMMRNIDLDGKNREIIEDMSRAIVKRLINPLIEHVRRNFKSLDMEGLKRMLKVYLDEDS